MKTIIIFILLSYSTPYMLAQNEDTPISHEEKGKSITEIIYADPIKDIDGNLYKTVVIGNQIWMMQNLKTTHYLNGDPILTTIPATLNISSQEKLDPLAVESVVPPPSPSHVEFPDEQPKYQWAYNGDDSNVEIFGRLYTWYAVADERKVCPEGWHVSTDRDWRILIQFLGGEKVAGGKLKAEGSEYWAEPNTGATNESGFTGLGAGGRDLDGTFLPIRNFGAWWTDDSRSRRHIEHDDSHIYRYYHYNSKIYGFSVRCVKD